jgi:hypothetical protein
MIGGIIGSLFYQKCYRPNLLSMILNYLYTFIHTLVDFFVYCQIHDYVGYVGFVKVVDFVGF